MQILTEEWRACFGGDYEISSLGLFRRAKPGRRTQVGKVLAQMSGCHGYLVVNPVVDGKNVQRYVHDLVALAFLGQRPDGLSVNHINGNKHDNRAANLEYVTHAENMAHAARTGLSARGERHGAAKINEETVRRIRELYDSGIGPAALARQFAISPALACQVGRRQRWAHVQ